MDTSVLLTYQDPSNLELICLHVVKKRKSVLPLVLPFTHKRTNPKRKHPGLVMSPEILNPESKVGTLNPESFAV